MDPKYIHGWLRLTYCDLFGPGYVDAHTEAIWTWVFNADPDGMAKVIIDMRANHGGDGRTPTQYATWH